MISRLTKGKTLSVFFCTATMFFGYLVYLKLEVEDNFRLASFQFYSLQNQYRRGGLKGYLKQKRQLRESVLHSLKNANGQAYQASTELAVYLFPELLSNDNFEKKAAQDLWEPQQQQIEARPHTRDSREQFRQMRANIWNYENPDREQPALSKIARQVIGVYEMLSRPRR